MNKENKGKKNGKYFGSIIISLVVVVFMLSFVSAQETIKIGIFQNEPIIYLDGFGEPQGIYADIINEIARSEGWNIEFIYDTWANNLEKLEAGELDLMTSIAYTEEREKVMDYSSENIFTMQGQVYIAPELEADNIADLDGLTIAILKGGINGINFINLCEQSNVDCNIVTAESYSEVLGLIESGEVSAGVVNNVHGSVLQRDFNVKHSSITFNPFNLLFAAPEEMNEEILATIDEYLERWKLDDNSVYYEYLDKWLGETLVEGKPIKSASELEYPPYAIVTEDGEADGFSVELLRAALDAVNFDVDFYVGPWNEIKQDLAEGRIQVLPVVGRTVERESIYDFSVPYLTRYGVIFVRDDVADINTLSDLRDKEVLVMKGDNSEEFVSREKISEYILTTESFEEAFKLLSEGKGDAIVAQEIVGLQLIEKLGITNIVSVSQINEFRQDYTFAVKEGDGELLALLNDGLSKVISDGTFNIIYDKWFGEMEELTKEKEPIKYNSKVGIIANSTFAEASIEQKAKDVARQIEIYLNANPEMTIKELQEDSYFRGIAVQPVGKTGYTVVNDYDTLSVKFHKDQSVVDLDLHTLADKLPDFWKVVSESKGGSESSGTYNWEEIDGSINRKYAYIANVDVKTADGVGLQVAATTYLDEYEETVTKENDIPQISMIWFFGVLGLFILGLFILGKLNTIELEKNIIMLLLAVALILIVGLFVFNAYNITKSLEELAIEKSYDSLGITASIENANMEIDISHLKNSILVMREKDLLSNEDLIRMTELEMAFLEVFVMDSKGKITHSSDSSHIGLSRSEDPYFLNARENGYTKPAYFSETTGDILFTLSVPYNGGVLTARVNLENITEIISKIEGLGETGESLLAYRDENGNAVFFTERRFETEVEARDIILKEEVDVPITQALLGNEESFKGFMDYRGVPVFAVTKYIEDLDVGLVVKIDQEEALEEVSKNINQIWYSTSGIIIAIIIIGLIFNFLISGALRKEVKRKTKSIKNKAVQLKRFVNIAIDREEKMIEMKKKLKEFEKNVK